MRWQWQPLPSPEARCLDGSRAGISIRAAAGGTSPKIRQANKKRWIIYFEGGGWCYSTADCALRALGELGSNSSTRLRGGPPVPREGHGIIDPCCSVSTDFCDYNKVFFHVCRPAPRTSDERS